MAIQQAWPHNLCDLGSLCRDGSPLGVSRIGISDLARLESSVKLEHFQTYMIYVAESRLWVMERMAVQTGELRQFVDIHDLTYREKKGLLQTFGSHREYMKWWVNGLSQHYPEQCRRVILLNVTSLFKAAWMPAKHYLSERTRRKVRLVDASRAYAAMQDVCEVDALPPFLGGQTQTGLMMSSKEQFEHKFFQKEEGATPPMPHNPGPAQAHVHETLRMAISSSAQDPPMLTARSRNGSPLAAPPVAGYSKGVCDANVEHVLGSGDSR